MDAPRHSSNTRFRHDSRQDIDRVFDRSGRQVPESKRLFTRECGVSGTDSRYGRSPLQQSQQIDQELVIESGQLREDIINLGVIVFRDSRIEDFDEQHKKSVDSLIQRAKTSPDKIAARECIDTLLFYATVFTSGNRGDIALQWFIKIESELAGCMDEYQHEDWECRLEKALNITSKHLFKFGYGAIKTNTPHDILKPLEVLNDVCMTTDKFHKMDKSAQCAYLACALRYALSRSESEEASKIMSLLPFEDICRWCKEDLKNNHAAWCCRLNWLSCEVMPKRNDNSQLVRRVRDMEEDISQKDEEFWLNDDKFNTHHSYYKARTQCAQSFFLANADDCEEQTLTLIHQLKNDAPCAYKNAPKRIDIMIRDVSQTLVLILLDRKRFNEAEKVIAEIHEIEKRYDQFSCKTLMLEADLARGRYENSLQQGWPHRIDELRSFIEKLNYHFDAHISVPIHLAQLHMALGENQKAEDVLASYDGTSPVAYRIRAMNLAVLGQFEEAVNTIAPFVQKTSPVYCHILLEQANILKDWADSVSASDKEKATDLNTRALDAFIQAIKAGKQGWKCGWNGFGHFLAVRAEETKNNRSLINFSEIKHRLPAPLDTATSWSSAVSLAFIIADSKSSEEAIHMHQMLPEREKKRKIHPESYGLGLDSRRRGPRN